MKLKGFDLDQVRSEAEAIEDHRQHELRRGRKPPDDDTIRIPVALLRALLDRVDPPPSKHDFRLTTSRYVRPGTFAGSLQHPPPGGPVFRNPHDISAADLEGNPIGSVALTPGNQSFTFAAPRHTPYEYETTADIDKCNMCFAISGSDVPLVVSGQTGKITYNGAIVGQAPIAMGGSISIKSLTAKCRVEHSMGCVVVDDVKVNG